MTQARRFAYLVRDASLQQEQVETLVALKNRIRGFKYGAMDAGDEEAANALFHLQCGLNAQIAFLKMWLSLKKSEYYEAWDFLIDAEEYISIAMRAKDGGAGLDEFLEDLRRVERVVFPGYNVYNSWGAVIRAGQCTICARPFSECDHVEGLVYGGRLCVRIRPEIVRVEHIALVEEPRDRRCVVTEFTSTEDGYYRDYMTLRKTRKAEGMEEGTRGILVSKIFSNVLLEID
jgi:hypothetical protein